MSYNTYPQNPFPSNSELLQKLNEVAKAIDDMPTFTSNDKAFLDELPAFPIVDGKKVLTATTESGETSLSYEEIENELPTEPSADGVKVLTATTESGETVLSWEELETSLPTYSTTPQKIGVYVDANNVSHDLYRKVVRFTSGADVRVELLSFPTTNIWLESGKVVNGDQIAPIPVLFVSVGTSSTFFYKDGSKTYLFMNLVDNNWRNKPSEITFIYCQ